MDTESTQRTQEKRFDNLPGNESGAKSNQSESQQESRQYGSEKPVKLPYPPGKVATPKKEAATSEKSQKQTSTGSALSVGLVFTGRAFSTAAMVLGVYLMCAGFWGLPAIPRYADYALRQANPDMLIIPAPEAQTPTSQMWVRPPLTGTEALLVAQYGAILTLVGLFGVKE